MNTIDVAKAIEKFCNPGLAESWDNCGFQICFSNKPVKRILVALEVTDKVIKEALNSNMDMIVTHHPLLFGGLKKIEDKSIIGNHVIKLVEAEISVYSCHTNFDKMDKGNNDYFGKVLGFSDVTKINGDDSGFCRKGELTNTLKPENFSAYIAEALDIDKKYIRIAGDAEKEIKTCAWCTGAGSEFIEMAFADGCDCYITGDLKYHEVQEAEMMGRCIIDAGHYGTEKIFVPNMAQLLRKVIPEDIEVAESGENLNPFK